MRLSKVDQEIEDRCRELVLRKQLPLGAVSLGMVLTRRKEREKSALRRANESPEQKEKRRVKRRPYFRAYRDQKNHEALTRAVEDAWTQGQPV